MKTLLISLLLICTIALQTDQLKYKRPIFKYSEEDVSLKNSNVPLSFSHSFRMCIIALRLYSLLKWNKRVKINDLLPNLTNYNTASLSISGTLVKMSRLGVCLFGVMRRDLLWVQAGIYSLYFHCIEKIKFKIVTKVKSIKELLEKSKDHIVIAYITNPYYNRPYALALYEPVALLRIQEFEINKGKIYYECECINSKNETIVFSFGIKRDRMDAQGISMANLWYLIK